MEEWTPTWWASKFQADFADVTVRDYFELDTIPQRIASWLLA